jgi:hypothetical protein
MLLSGSFGCACELVFAPRLLHVHHVLMVRSEDQHPDEDAAPIEKGAPSQNRSRLSIAARKVLLSPIRFTSRQEEVDPFARESRQLSS